MREWLGKAVGLLNNALMKTLLVIVTVGLMNAAAVHAQDSVVVEDPSVREILERDASQADYVKEVSCLNARRMRDTQVLDSRHVAFKMGKDEYYLVQFKNQCHGLRANRPVRLNMRNSRLCKYDSIQGFDPDSMMGLREGMHCSIPGFTQVTKAQVEQLKVSLKDQRQRARELAKEQRRKAREERRARRQAKT